MPRKKTVSTLEKSKVTAALSEISMLLNDKVAEAVATLTQRGVIDEGASSTITVALQETSQSCINTVRATRGI